MPLVIYSRIKQKIRHGLFPEDDISEINSTEFRSDLNFEDLRLDPMAEGIAHLEETASQTLKVQITATDPYRYRLGGIAHALSHIGKIDCSTKKPEY